MRLVDTDKIPWEYFQPIDGDLVIAKATIDILPTVDAEPVRHGKWKPFDEDEYTCSVCGNIFVTMDGEHPLSNEFKYCPFCGARMDGKVEEEQTDE